MVRARIRVGDIVHYVSHGTPVGTDGSQAFPSACRAAIITEVAAEGEHLLLTGQAGMEYTGYELVVGLAVLNPSGLFFHRAAMDPDGRSGGTWHWPERT
jgi:hypothetical protein